MLSERLCGHGLGQTLMCSVAEIGSGVASAELPLASDTMVLE